MKTLEELAIKESLNGNWPQAIKINKQILETDKKNVDALNRLSFAYIQNDNKTLAKKTIGKILKIDKFNHIAQKNLSLLTKLPKQSKSDNPYQIKNVTFIEEPGTSRIVNLINPCQKSVFLKLRPGTKLDYKLKCHRICISWKKNYIGKFPDDLNHKLAKILAKKEIFEIFFKSFENNKPCVLLKESRGRQIE